MARAKNQTYLSAQVVLVVLEVCHARPPVFDLEGLRVLLSPTVSESALGKD